MSLLPGEMLPFSEPIGRANEDGTVTIDKNWWLLFYNLCQQTLSSGGSFPAAAITELASTDSDAADTDAMALRKPIDNLAQLTALESDPVPCSSIAAALAFASDPLLPDPAPAAQPYAVIVVGGSPFTYTARAAGTLVITGGTVSAVTLGRQAATVATGLTSGLFPLCRGDTLQITHTGAPTATFIPWSSQ